ncbi:MAG: hypothetical protein RRZ84_02815 [Romboutsia sp.]
MNNKVDIVLKGQAYSGKLDMRCLANVQAELRKQGQVLTMQQIFNGIVEQDLNVVMEIAVQAILRCHKQVKRTTVEDKMDFSEMDNVFNFIAQLAELAMPKAEGK